MFELLKQLREAIRAEKKPKYRLVPDEKGTYTLEMYHTDVSVYLTEAVWVTKYEADIHIKNIEREIIYYREEE